MNVLAMGTSQVQTIVVKMKELEATKILLQSRIGELTDKMKAAYITQDMIELYLEQHRQQIESKNMDACKKFIASYVEEVVIYKEEIEVKILLVISGGGGAYRAISRMEK